MRNMKLKYYLAAVSVLIGLSVTAQQGKSKDNQGKDKTEVVKEGKGQKEVEDDIDETKTGNAYGKNKGELEGKDYGQDRAEQAKLEHKEKILERNLGIVRNNINVLDAWVSQEPHITYIRPRAGTTALLYYDMDISSTDLCHKLMEEEGVMLVPGDCFNMGKCMRIGYAFNQEELTEGLEALGRCLRKYD